MTVACPGVSRFDCCDNQDFFDRMDAVNNARKDGENRIVTKKHYESLERTMGMQSNCYGLLAAPDLRCYVRPADIITHDVQHICFCGGVVGVELYQFLKKLKEAVGMEAHHIRPCLQANWSFPGHRKDSGRALSDLFSPARMEASNAASRFKGQASELLAIDTMLRHIVVEHIGKVPDRLHRAQKEFESFMAMCDVCDSVRLYKSGGWENSAAFLSTVQLYLMKFYTAYGLDGDEVRYAVPKHHKLLHTPRQIDRDGFMMDNWTTERKNGIVKKAFEHTHNDSSLEKTVFSANSCTTKQNFECTGGVGRALEPASTGVPRHRSADWTSACDGFEIHVLQMHSHCLWRLDRFAWADPQGGCLFVH